MGYRVIQRFVDLQDNNYRYEVGDEYPRLNVNVSKKRLAELASNKNKRKIPLIKEYKAEEVDATGAEDAQIKQTEPNEPSVKRRRKDKKRNDDAVTS